MKRLLAVLVFLTACKGRIGSSGDEDRVAALRETLALDIQKTRAFYLAGAEPQGESETATPSLLYAVQDDGTPVPVDVTLAIPAASPTGSSIRPLTFFSSITTCTTRAPSAKPFPYARATARCSA